MPLYNDLEKAFAELERQREALTEMQQELAGAETTVTSKNRAVAVTINSQGRITEIKFPSGAYRSMAAPELGALLVDTIQLARDEMMQATAARFEGLMPGGLNPLDMMRGNLDIDAMMRDALKTMNASRAEDATGRRDSSGS
ncbi:hypothetical protein GCM10022251_74520 [Phytohabitans flavus]